MFAFLAVYRVIRNQGNYGNVNVSWVVDPACTNDVYPEGGTIFFDNLEFSKNITIYSLPDEVNTLMLFYGENVEQRISAKILESRKRMKECMLIDNLITYRKDENTWLELR